jgi:hypothetical protein
VLRVLLEKKEQQVHKALKVKLVQGAQQAHKVLKEIQVPQE